MNGRLFFVLILFTTLAAAQSDSLLLPEPTGRYAVGTMTYQWTDPSRETPITAHQGDRRMLVVQVWYPARVDSLSQRAPYAPLSNNSRHVIPHSHLRPSFHPEVESAPLLLIAPGRGTARYRYTALAEDLASHGYVVAAVDMPEIGYVRYLDGTTVEPSAKFRPPPGMMGGPYEKVDAFFEAPTALGLEDLNLTLDRISELHSSDPNGRFTGRLNMEAVGIFGHSLGGRIAGALAASNPKVKALIAMEGIPPRDIRYEGKLEIPVAMLCSSGTWPYAKDNYMSLIDNRAHPVFMIELSGFGHNSVTDGPYIDPAGYGYDIDPTAALKLTRALVLDYFNSVFRGKVNFSPALYEHPNISIRAYE